MGPNVTIKSFGTEHYLLTRENHTTWFNGMTNILYFNGLHYILDPTQAEKRNKLLLTKRTKQDQMVQLLQDLQMKSTSVINERHGQ
jgi:hypothetical protein